MVQTRTAEDGRITQIGTLSKRAIGVRSAVRSQLEHSEAPRVDERERAQARASRRAGSSEGVARPMQIGLRAMAMGCVERSGDADSALHARLSSVVQSRRRERARRAQRVGGSEDARRNPGRARALRSFLDPCHFACQGRVGKRLGFAPICCVLALAALARSTALASGGHSGGAMT
ncbi:hypothetical protein OH77DRAFT_1422280 [Trametes cingulata]|nr:hypothetical protein OH77DRAFT_1422280 [Trametes cingulata]